MSKFNQLVLVKFKAETTEIEIRNILKSIEELKELIPGILSFRFFCIILFLITKYKIWNMFAFIFIVAGSIHLQKEGTKVIVMLLQ